MRAGMEASIGLFPLPEGLRAERVDVGDVPAEWIHMPESSPERTLLYLHGGGYCIGSINTHRGLVAEIARTSGCRALLLDYRLAPEHPFPAAVDDALAAWRFLLDEGGAASRPGPASRGIRRGAGSPWRRCWRPGTLGSRCPARRPASRRGSTSRASASP